MLSNWRFELSMLTRDSKHLFTVHCQAVQLSKMTRSTNPKRSISNCVIMGFMASTQARWILVLIHKFYNKKKKQRKNEIEWIFLLFPHFIQIPLIRFSCFSSLWKVTDFFSEEVRKNYIAWLMMRPELILRNTLLHWVF